MTRPGLTEPAPRRILIIRASAIGDVVFAAPMAEALRRTYPGAHIAWLVEPGIHELLLADPCVDEIIIWPKGEWRTLWRERHFGRLAARVAAFAKRLKAARFDLVLDLQGLLKSGLLTWMTRAPRRVGLGSREGSQWLMTQVIPIGGQLERISSEYLHCAEQLGLSCGDFRPRMSVSPEADAQARALLAERGLEPGRYAVLAPFTTRPQKHWFVDAWQALAPALRDRFGLVPVILGGPADRDPAEVICAGSAGIVSLAGETRLPQAAALVQHAGLLVGVDTGLTHMGIALNTPTVALFGSTRPYLDTTRLNARVIWLGLDCSPCRRRPTCGGSFDCLRDITPQRVLEEAALVLEAPR
ncbi:MAG: glycosyltransferase family 9 protein [Pseudomonadota bacterium]